MNELQRAKFLTEDEWQAAIVVAEREQPWRVASVPKWHRYSERNFGEGDNVLRHKAVLAHGAPLPEEWCVCMLTKAQQAEKLTEGVSDVSKWFTDLDVKLTLTVEPLEADAARPPKTTAAVETRASTRSSLASLASKGKGLYFFSTAQLPFLNRPGTYKLTFAALGAATPITPLSVQLTRAPRPLRRALDASCRWELCTHAGACNVRPGSRRCQLLDDALAAGACNLVLGGARLALPLHINQVDADGRRVCFPDDLDISQLTLSVWSNHPTEKQYELDVTLAKLTAADMDLSEDGTELRIRSVRVIKGVLPSGPKERTGPAAPLTALLRVTIPGYSIKSDQLHGGGEMEVRLVPGNATRLVALSGAWSAAGGGADEGVAAAAGASSVVFQPRQDVALRVALLDEWGNPTLRMPSSAAATQLRMYLTRMDALSLKEGPSGPGWVAIAAEGLSAGIAKVNLRVSGKLSEHIKVRLAAEPDRLQLELKGVVATRMLRVALPPGALPLRGDCSGQLTALAGAVTVTASDDDAEPCADFDGMIVLCDADDENSEWHTGLLSACRFAVRAGRVQLPSITLPAQPGTYRLGLRLEDAPEAHTRFVPIVVAAPAPALLVPLPPGAAARVGEPFALTFEARSDTGVFVPISHALLAAVQLVGDDESTIEARKLDNGRGVLSVRLQGAPGQVSVRMRVDADAAAAAAAAAPGGSADAAPTPAAALPELPELRWDDISLEAGPPERCEVSVRDAVRADCGAFAVSQGSALTVDVSFVDAQGYAAAPEGGGSVQLELSEDAAAWLVLPRARSWPVGATDAAAEVGPLRLARDAPPGRHVITGVLAPPPPPRTGRNTAAHAAVVAAWEKRPRVSFEIALLIEPGRFATEMTINGVPSTAQLPQLTVEAGAPLPTGAVRVCAAGGVAPEAPAAQLSVSVCRARDPRVLQRALLDAAEAMEEGSSAGGGGLRFDDSAALEHVPPQLRAPTKAGDYMLVLHYEDGSDAPALTARRPLRVIGAASGRLVLSFADVTQLPGRVAVQPGAGAGLLAPELTFRVRDAHGNAVDLRSQWLTWQPRICYERCDAEDEDAGGAGADDEAGGAGAAAAAPPLLALPSPVKVEEPDVAQLHAQLAVGRLHYRDVRTGADWACGQYRVWLQPRRIMGAGTSEEVDVSSATHTFLFVNADASAAEHARVERHGALLNAATTAERAAHDARREYDAARAAAAAAIEEAERAQAAVDAAELAAATARAAFEAATAASEAGAAHLQAERARAPAALHLALRDPRTPPHVPAYMQLRNRRTRDGGLAAGLSASAEVLCQVWELIRAETPAVGAALVHAAGSSSLSMLVTRTQAGAVLAKRLLPEERSVFALDHASALRRFWTGGVDASHPQGLLQLPRVHAVGFVGYAVNLVHLTAPQLAVRVAAPANASAALRASGVGLRAAVLYPVFGDLKVFDTEEHMDAFDHNRHGSRGVFSLTGHSVGGDGRQHGKSSRPMPTFFAPPGVPWEERRTVRVRAYLPACLPASHFPCAHFCPAVLASFASRRRSVNAGPCAAHGADPHHRSGGGRVRAGGGGGARARGA
jgi:hypothetical protein